MGNLLLPNERMKFGLEKQLPGQPKKIEGIELKAMRMMIQGKRLKDCRKH